MAALAKDYERSAAREDEDMLSSRPEDSFFPEYVVAATAISELRIDFGIKDLKKQIESVETGKTGEPSPSVRNDWRSNNSNDRPERNSKNIKCFNCLKLGDMFRFYKEKKRLFCFGCGIDESRPSIPLEANEGKVSINIDTPSAPKPLIKIIAPSFSKTYNNFVVQDPEKRSFKIGPHSRGKYEDRRINGDY